MATGFHEAPPRSVSFRRGVPLPAGVELRLTAAAGGGGCLRGRHHSSHSDSALHVHAAPATQGSKLHKTSRAPLGKLRESVGAVEVVVVGRKCPILPQTLERNMTSTRAHLLGQAT